MKTWAAIILAIGLLAGGGYLIIYSGFFLGIVQIVEGITATPANGWQTARGCFRVFILPTLVGVGMMLGGAFIKEVLLR